MLQRFFFLLFVTSGLSAQKIGMGTAYFFPVDAPMAVAVPPIALRGSLIEREHWQIDFGLTWYRMGGMSAEGMPFPADRAIVEPFNSFVIPLQLGARIPFKGWRFEPKIGGFTAINSVYNVHQENLAVAILRSTDEWRAFQTTAEIGQNNTFGLLASLFFVVPIDNGWEIHCGASWYEGRMEAPITGNAVGVRQNDEVVDLALDFPNAYLDYRGFELALGLQFDLNHNGTTNR